MRDRKPPPAFQFYWQDFMTGTVTMSLAERGAYMTLLCYQWDRGSVPSDPVHRARLLNCPRVVADRAWAVVRHKFVRGPDDQFRNQKLEHTRGSLYTYLDEQARRGSNGARYRWGTRAGANLEIPDTQPLAGAIAVATVPPCSADSSSSSVRTRAQYDHSTLPKTATSDNARAEKGKDKGLWTRLLAIAHAVIEDTDREHWGSEMKHRCIVQGLPYARPDDANNTPTYRRALLAAEALRIKRGQLTP